MKEDAKKTELYVGDIVERQIIVPKDTAIATK